MFAGQSLVKEEVKEEEITVDVNSACMSTNFNEHNGAEGVQAIQVISSRVPVASVGVIDSTAVMSGGGSSAVDVEMETGVGDVRPGSKRSFSVANASGEIDRPIGVKYQRANDLARESTFSIEFYVFA